MFDVIVDMSSVRRTFIPDIFLHQCCQHSFHNLSVMRQKAKPDKKNIRDNLPHTQTHKHTNKQWWEFYKIVCWSAKKSIEMNRPLLKFNITWSWNRSSSEINSPNCRSSSRWNSSKVKLILGLASCHAGTFALDGGASSLARDPPPSPLTPPGKVDV